MALELVVAPVRWVDAPAPQVPHLAILGIHQHRGICTTAEASAKTPLRANAILVAAICRFVALFLHTARGISSPGQA